MPAKTGPESFIGSYCEGRVSATFQPAMASLPSAGQPVVDGELHLVGIGLGKSCRVGGEEVHDLAAAPGLGDAIREGGDFLGVHGNSLRFRRKRLWRTNID